MLTPLTLGADLALLLASAGSAFWAWQLRQRLEHERALLSAWALSALFIALAIPAQFLPAEPGNDLGVLRQMSQNLAIYIALPLMAAALYALGRRWLWSAAGWGRLMLGLFAAFELSREMGYGEDYLQVLGAAAVAASLTGGLRLKRPLAQRLAVLAVLLLAIGLALISPAAPDWGLSSQWQDPASFRTLCALSLLLLSAALHSELVPVDLRTQ